MFGIEMDEQVRAFYETNPRMVSSPFGGVDGINSELMGEVFDALDIDLAGKRILDVGCGRGYAGEWVRAQGGSYFGADFVVSRRGFPLVRADAPLLPFSDTAFDGLFCVDMFEHLPDPRAAAREFHRVLRPDGFVFLSAPNYSNVAGVVKRLSETFGGYRKNTWAPFGRWQPQELEQPLTGRFVERVFRDGGFNRFRRMGYGGEVGLGLFPWIDHPRMPEAVQFRLQRLFAAVGKPISSLAPGASLHGFWKIGC